MYIHVSTQATTMTSAPSSMPRLKPGATVATEQRLVERDEEDEAEVDHHHRDGEGDGDAPARSGDGFEGGSVWA